MIPLSYSLVLGALLFAIGVVGIFRNLRSINVDDLGSLKG